MDNEFAPDTILAAPAADAHEMPTDENPLIETASSEYLGRWNRLVSTTNWEKGRIVAEWREALSAAGAPVAAYADEAWSRRVGNLTPQHTGRLRRVYQRFTSVRDAYPGLYWSHFQAALDWEDAEMWLEGAVQNRWSISQMQCERSRAFGALVEESVEATEVEVDEDAAAPPVDAPTASPTPMQEALDAGGEDVGEAEISEGAEDGPLALNDSSPGSDAPPVRPFENLPVLPADLRDAFDSFKLAIVHHRLSNWQEVSLADVLATLEALRQLALAPVQE